MMNKKVLIILSCCFLLFGSVVFGMKEIAGINKTEGNTNHVNNTVLPENLNIEDKANELYITSEKYDFIGLLQSKGYYEDEINEIIIHFMEIQSVFSLSSDEISEFYELVSNDYDIEKLMEIFEFTIYTDKYRDMNYVKQIYDKADEMKIVGNYWVEDAYNILTDNRGGVLSQSQIAECIEEGFTIEEIYASNIMSRRGVYAVDEILKDRKSGKKWSDIADEIYPEMQKKSKTFSEENAVNIVTAVMKSKITGISASEIMNDATDADLKISKAIEAAGKASERMGMYPGGITENIINSAVEKFPDVEREKIVRWLEDGNSIRSMEMIKEESDEDGIPFEEKIKGVMHDVH